MGPSRFPSERLPSESDQSESFQSELFGQNVSWNHNYGQIKKNNFNNFNSKNECGTNARFSCSFLLRAKKQKINVPLV